MARKPYLEFSVEDRHVGSYVYHQHLKQGVFEARSKADGCEACLRPFGQGPIEGHREDYSSVAPEEVLILCYRCHRVVHMRDRYADGWDFYRDKVREGFRWPWIKDIGPAAGDMRAKNISNAELLNAPREETVLDHIHEGVYLKGTREDRQKRLKELYRLAEELRNGGQVGLF